MVIVVLKKCSLQPRLSHVQSFPLPLLSFKRKKGLNNTQLLNCYKWFKFIVSLLNDDDVPITINHILLGILSP